MLILALSMVFVAGLGYLTVDAVSKEGFTLLSAISVFVLVLLAVGVLGALFNSPR